MKKFFPLFLALLFFCSTSLFGVKFIKIGFVDVEEIFASYPGTAEIRQKLKGEKDKMQIEIDKQKENIARLEKDYQLNSDRLSEDERGRREAEIEYKKELLIEYIDDSNKKLGTLKDELTRPIYIKIATVIQRVSAEKGFSFVFKKGSDSLLYANKEYDLTKEIKLRISRELSVEERN